MLAHKASHEGKIAAEVICGKNSSFDNAVIPAVVYNDPEIMTVGLTEADAIAQGKEEVKLPVLPSLFKLKLKSSLAEFCPKAHYNLSVAALATYLTT